MQLTEHNSVGLQTFLLILVPGGIIYLPLLLSLDLHLKVKEYRMGGREEKSNSNQ